MILIMNETSIFVTYEHELEENEYLLSEGALISYEELIQSYYNYIDEGLPIKKNMLGQFAPEEVKQQFIDIIKTQYPEFTL
jgi:hypothetical protein